MTAVLDNSLALLGLYPMLANTMPVMLVWRSEAILPLVVLAGGYAQPIDQLLLRYVRLIAHRSDVFDHRVTDIGFDPAII